MTGRGRPLRFLVGVVGGWTLLRAWLLWPAAVADLSEAWHHPVRLVTPAAAATMAAPPRQAPAVVARSTIARPAPVRAPPAPAPDRTPSDLAPAAAEIDPGRVHLAQAAVLRLGEPIPTTILPPPATGSRWSGSAWLIARPGGTPTPATLGAGQLGGSQAGARLVYALDAARHWALTGRFSAPLHGAGREIGLGIAWRPTALAVTAVVEARVPLDGGSPAPVAGIVAGLNPTPVVAGFRLEAYGQAGVIGRGAGEGFADGAARLTRPLPLRALKLDLGVGAWGGAQKGAARLDLGPSLGVAVRLAGQPLRLALDWRERVAGEARPGSGPALSLGADF